jgi:hypothetical protein
MAKILMPDSQSFDLEDEMAQSDDTLRAALKAAYPDAANATFERSGGKDGKPLVVKVIKKAGTKGRELIADLRAAPESLNPAVAMQQRLAAMETAGELDHVRMLSMRDEINAAAKAGYEEIRSVIAVFEALTKAPAEAGKKVPMGF